MRKISGAGHILNQFVTEDAGASRPPTEVTDTWLNDVQNELVAAAQKDGAALGVSDHQLADVIGSRLRHLSSGAALPPNNIGPIWHDDYNSIMTWQAFTSNGAVYTGYASVLVGSLLADTQPTLRSGYIKSGSANLNRNTYAALRAWAIHNGIMVAPGAWAAGMIAVKDNVDGTTFAIFDVRAEFPRFWDDGRGQDSGRAFGSWQGESVDSAGFQLREAITTWATQGVQIGASVAYFQNAPIPSYGSNITIFGGNETRPRNVSLLASVKF